MASTAVSIHTSSLDVYRSVEISPPLPIATPARTLVTRQRQPPRAPTHAYDGRGHYDGNRDVGCEQNALPNCRVRWPTVFCSWVEYRRRDMCRQVCSRQRASVTWHCGAAVVTRYCATPPRDRAFASKALHACIRTPGPLEGRGYTAGVATGRPRQLNACTLPQMILSCCLRQMQVSLGRAYAPVAMITV